MMDVTGASVIGREARDLPEAFLGPAEVIEIHGAVVRVALPGGVAADAEMALAFPYAPAPGDVLLVIGSRGAHYVIGVLRGRGRASLTFQGDLDLRAVGGSIALASDRGVTIDAPEVTVQASKLRTIAESVVSTCASLVQRVTSIARLHAKDAHVTVDESAITQAGSATILADEAVTVNGKQILLG